MSAIESPEALPTSEAQPTARPSLFSALRVRDFRLVWLGEGISLLGDQFYMIALPWLALQLTGSGLVLGAVAAVGGIPRAVFMLLGGAVTDRFSPRSVMLVSNVLRIFLTGWLTIAIFSHSIQVWMLFVSALLFGLIDAFFFPANSSILPQIVSEEKLASGNAITQITFQFAGLVGPALAGLVIASLSGTANGQALAASDKTAATGGVGAALAFDTLTFVVAAVAVWLLTNGRKATTAKGDGFKGMMQSIGEGIRIVWNDLLIRTLILVTTAINFLLTGPIGIGMPVLANSRYAEGAAAMGYIFSSFGGGALVGALLAGALPTPRKVGLTAMALIVVTGIMLGLFGVVSSLPGIVAVAAVMGLTVGYINVMASTAIQKLIPTEAMGRVMSLMMLGSFGLAPISNMIAGVLVDVSLNGLFIGAGVILIGIALYSATNREVRGFVQQAPAAG